MHRSKILSPIIIIAICLLQANGADKYTDENRPYEFGFTIEGEQHRHEKKDEKGIIMGEFGFITADGVYHVTVYATDENGNFKILSMKNIRVKPYPSGLNNDQRTPTIQAGPNAISAAPAAPTTPASASLSPAAPIRSCSNCRIPTSTTRAPPIQSLNNYNNPDQSLRNLLPPHANQADTPRSAQGEFNNPTQNTYNRPNQYSSGQGGYDQQNQSPQNNVESGSGQIYPNSVGKSGSFPGIENRLRGTQPDYQSNDFQGPSQGINPVDRTPKRYDLTQPSLDPKNYDPQNQISRAGTQSGRSHNKPVLISAQMQIVDPNTDIHYKAPGERDGLPSNLDKNDMIQLLYTFNYTVGFHGHHEEGYRNGAKKGYYFITGRNGVRTRVDYEADANGFRPKITQEVLDLLSDDVPKPETEKEDKYGLKGYEFKWLYFPAESKRQ